MKHIGNFIGLVVLVAMLLGTFANISLIYYLAPQAICYAFTSGDRACIKSSHESR